MQFRKRVSKTGEVKIQIIRWVYDEYKQRTLPICLGTVPSTLMNVPKPILEKCSPDERVEVNEFWKINRIAAASQKMTRLVNRLQELTTEISDGYKKGWVKETELPAIRSAGERLNNLGKGQQLDLVDHLAMHAA